MMVSESGGCKVLSEQVLICLAAPVRRPVSLAPRVQAEGLDFGSHLGSHNFNQIRPRFFSFEGG